MILATAVALATFSLASWSVGASNRSRVAALTVGAPTVFTVAPKVGTDLGALVTRLDPGGRHAAAVETFASPGSTFVAVQPQRFAAVANWGSSFVPDATKLLARLHPPAPEPIVLSGDRVRLRVGVAALKPTGDRLTLHVFALGASAPTPVDLGALPVPKTTKRLSAELPCDTCVVRDLEVDPPGAAAVQVHGALTLSDLEVHTSSGWHPVSGVAASGAWTDNQDQRVSIRPSGGSVSWSFVAAPGVPAVLRINDHPEPLPAVVSTAVAHGDATVGTTGLDGGGTSVLVAAEAANVPGAPASGVVVDLTYAERAVAGDVSPATAQVWVRGSADNIRRGLRAAAVPILGTQSSAELDDAFSRQGPGLASVLFLADAVAAAVLAALAAVLSLSVSARRRRYEYAALAAAGAPSRSLYGAVAIEQLVVVGFGTVVGVAAGLLATVLAAHSVPEFVTEPAEALLRYRPDVVFLAATLVGGLIAVLAAAAVAAATLMRSVTPEELREAPS